MSESIQTTPTTRAESSLKRACEVLLEQTAWLDYAGRVYAIDPGKGYPFFTYFGINFTGEAIKNFKFYFSFSKRLAREEIEQLLPVPDRGRFDEFYEKWHPSQEYKALHRGTTFAVKVETDGTLTNYYHLRVRGLPFGPPERLPIATGDRDNYHGVCEEFTGGKRSLKRYFYLHDKGTIAESLRIAGMPDRSAFVDTLEYIESEGRDKMDWITRDPRLIQTLVHKRGPAGLSPAFGEICNTCDAYLFAPGSARELGDHAIYVFPKSLGYWFDGVRDFAVRYLGLHRYPSRG